jgi:opacity protein-like surface antigen
MSEDWVDPMVGLRLIHEFSERWYAILRAEIGGFGVGSELTWQALAGVGYRIGQNTSVFLGYRHLDVDYDETAFVYDAAISGVLLGLQFEF